MATQEQIQEITNKIAREFKPEKIILFGSYAWGKPTKDSDVDLFIVKKTKKPRLNRQLEVRRLINGEIAADILVYTPKETQKRIEMRDFFINDILTKGKTLYSTQ